MTSSSTQAVHGLAEYKAALMALPDKLARRVLRNALAAGARQVRDDAKARAPVLSAPSQRRRPGTLRDAIKVRTSKRDARAGNVGVFINVKPAKGGRRGAKSPVDPYYWRWVEFGTRKMAARPFLSAASGRLGSIAPTIVSKISSGVARLNHKTP